MKYIEFQKTILDPELQKEMDELKAHIVKYIEDHKKEDNLDGIIRLITLLVDGGVPLRNLIICDDPNLVNLIGQLAVVQLVEIARSVHRKILNTN